MGRQNISSRIFLCATATLDYKPSEALLLASRSQHIGRWEHPRESYPADRVGYLTWRKELGQMHAQKATQIMQELGYSTDEMAKVEHIILKKGIKNNVDVQTIENALCLVFLQFQYEEFHPKHEPEKVINILKKSLQKMDTQGHEYALTLNYSDQGLHYIQQALLRL
jgi:NACalpha-BTF3-like transcription factor